MAADTNTVTRLTVNRNWSVIVHTECGSCLSCWCWLNSHF